jgi:hypothetical protein
MGELSKERRGLRAGPCSLLATVLGRAGPSHHLSSTVELDLVMGQGRANLGPGLDSIGELTDSATTQIQIKGFGLAHPNTSPVKLGPCFTGPTRSGHPLSISGV